MEKHYRKLLCLILLVFYSFILISDNKTSRGNVSDNITANALPILSGSLTKLPWDNDKKFLKAKEESKTNTLIAAYKTVLLDPLPGEEYNVHLCARLLSGTVIKSGEIFSQNETVGPYTAEKGYKKGPTYTGSKLITTTGGGICKIATTLYNVAVLSNLPIVERHYHSMPVSYVPYGQDAAIAYGSRDFKFENNTKFPILIWAQGIDDTLYIAFYGKERPPKIQWHHEVLEVNKTSTIIKKNAKLPKGTKKVIVEGMDGKIVKSWVNIYNINGEVLLKKMGLSVYKPLLNVIEINE